jgi:hypothetical protein
MSTEAPTTTAPAITAAMLAELVIGRSTAVIVQDATGTIRPVAYLDRFAAEDPDTIVLLTRDEAIATLNEAAQAATQAMRAAGVIV